MEESASRSKILAYRKMSKKMNTCQNQSVVQPLDLSAANIRSFQVPALISKDLLTLTKTSQLILVNSN